MIDLINPITGKPSDIVVFAGENGTGKTTILESISSFLTIGSFEYFDYIEYIISGNVYRAISSQHSIKNFYNIIMPDGSVVNMNSDRSNNPDSIRTNILDIRHYGCVISKARSNYNTNKITYTSTKQLDEDKYNKDEVEDFTELKQLLVDVSNQDSEEYMNANILLGNTPKSWNAFYPDSKGYRFRNAFNSFFGNMTYDKVIDINGEKVILFKKYGKIIPVDNLSTGEKQIVFRGVYLLRNSLNLIDSTIMVDEPELSMHPKWQKRILNYYENLFTKNNNIQVQLFAATHSEYVLEEALNENNKCIVIILNDVNGTLNSKKISAPSVLPTITSAETNYLAFDVVSNDYHIELYGRLQQKESLSTVKGCDTFIKNSQYYNNTIHSKQSSHGNTTYSTISTYIRNAIDHPDPSRTFNESELRKSIELLIQLCR